MIILSITVHYLSRKKHKSFAFNFLSDRKPSTVLYVIGNARVFTVKRELSPQDMSISKDKLNVEIPFWLIIEVNAEFPVVERFNNKHETTQQYEKGSTNMMRLMFVVQLALTWLGFKFNCYESNFSKQSFKIIRFNYWHCNS